MSPTKNERARPSVASRFKQIPNETLAAIGEFDTCAIANAIEHFGVRLRNEGFTRPGLRCLTAGPPRLLGYAATCRVRSADPPMTGRAYTDRADWWDEIDKLPAPRIAVIQDIESAASGASTVGGVHAAILKALGCHGVITNGAVRDLPEVNQMQFPMFASAASVSHAYLHIVEYACPVEIFGLRIHAGDLLYADMHGVLSIPLEIAADLPRAASRIREQEDRIIRLCQSPEFSIEKLRQAVQNTNEENDVHRS